MNWAGHYLVCEPVLRARQFQRLASRIFHVSHDAGQLFVSWAGGFERERVRGFSFVCCVGRDRHGVRHTVQLGWELTCAVS